MASVILVNGVGELLGATLALSKPLIVRAAVWWVNFTTGIDAASPSGQDRSHPLKTLSQAITNIAAGDMIILEDGHAEVFTAALNISKRCTVVGGGSAAGVPTVTFQTNSAAAGIFTLGQTDTEIINIRLLGAAQANSASKIQASAARARLRQVRVECSALDTGAGIEFVTGGDAGRVEDCTLVSTATAIASRPGRGLVLTNALPDVEIIRCTFDDGTVGFATAACDLSVAIPTRAKIETVHLLRGADLLMHASSAACRISLGTVSGGGRVVW